MTVTFSDFQAAGFGYFSFKAFGNTVMHLYTSSDCAVPVTTSAPSINVAVIAITSVANTTAEQH